MTNEEAIHAIKSNYPPERYTMLREALDMAMVLLAAEFKPMINWIKYDPAKPPEKRKMYLMCEGEDIGLGYLEENEVFGLSWWDAGDTGLWNGVTHYAHINLPGEDKSDEEKRD